MHPSAFCDSFLDFFFTSNSDFKQVSSFRAQARFFSMFPSKSAKVAVDFKCALFLVQIITSGCGFYEVEVYSVLMGLVGFRVIINHGCSMVLRFPLVTFGFSQPSINHAQEQHTGESVLLFVRPTHHISHFTNLRSPTKFGSIWDIFF